MSFYPEVVHVLFKAIFLLVHVPLPFLGVFHWPPHPWVLVQEDHIPSSLMGKHLRAEAIWDGLSVELERNHTYSWI